MARYSDYAKKLVPWVKAKNFLVRHRVFLLCLSGAVVCALATLTSTKGVVKDDAVINSHITYGQQLSYSASAFLGEASYEFSPASEESWSSLVPSEVGSYKMRAKSGNSFGGEYYGSVHYFTIDPYATSCSLAATSYLYGSKPSLSIELLGGDRVADYDVVYDDLEKEHPVASIANLRIENASGGDATGNYAVTFSSGEVSFLKRSLELTFKSKSFVFDAQEHSLEGDFYTMKGELASGDEIVFETNSILDVGSLPSAKEGSIKVMHEGKDVTKHYSIVADCGALNVNKAPLSLKSASRSKEYDGNPFANEDYQSVEKIGLQGGDEVSVAYEDQSSNFTPGSYKNRFSYAFSSGLEANYEVAADYGELTIFKRRLGVRISGTHAYAGSNFAGPIPESEIEYSGSLLLSGHKASFLVEASEEDNCLGGKPNIVPRIVDADGNDVTSYYEISLDSSSLRYEKRELKVKATDVGFVYDGEIHQGAFECEGLAEGDRIEYADEPFSAKDLPKGSSSLTYVYKPKIRGVYREGEDRTKYYDIELKGGTFALQARPLSVLLVVDRSYEDRGTSIEDDLSEAEYAFLDDTSLVENHSISISVDKTSNVYTDPKFNVAIFDGNNEDVTHNYAIQRSQSSSCSFFQSQITLSSYQGVSFDYDGTMHQLNPTVAGLRSGDEIIWKEGCGPADHQEFRAGVYNFELSIAKIVHSSTQEDVSRHYRYESTYQAGFTIEKAPMVTATLITSRVYDGTEYGDIPWAEGTDYAFEGLQSTDKGTIALNECPFLNKGTTDFEVKIINADHNVTVNDCYEKIEKVNANNIAWEKGPLVVAAKSELNPSFVYDGSAPKAMVSVEGLADKDALTFACNGRSYLARQDGVVSFDGICGTDVGAYPLDVEIKKVFHSGSETDASAYYSPIEAVNGTLTIVKRPLRLKIYEHGSAPGYDPDQNGVCYTAAGGTSLALDQKLKFTYELSEEGKVEYVPHIYDPYGKEVTSNYAIDLDGANVFDRIPLTVGYSDETVVYDGKEHSLSPYVAGMPGNCSLSSETIALKSNPREHQLLYAGTSYTYTPEVLSIKDAEGCEETNLYDVSCLSGTLSIAKRPICIAISGSKTYDGSLFSSSSLSSGEYSIIYSGADSGLASTDKLTITPKDDGTGSIIGAADSSDFDVRITCGNEDRTSNYDISLSVSYAFEKADVKIETDGGSVTYDAEEHEGAAQASGVGGDLARANSDGQRQTEAGTYAYTLTVTSLTTSQGEDRTAYYNVPSSKEASFTIGKKDLSIAFPSQYVVSTRANGTPKDLNAEFENFSSGIRVNGLPSGFKVVDYVFKDGPSTDGTFFFADYLSSYKIVNAEGEDKTANFNAKISGSFVVKKKLEFDVLFRNVSKTYDGDAFDLKSNFYRYSLTPIGEKNDFYLYYLEESTALPSYRDAGSYSETMRSSFFYVVDGSGNKVPESEYVINFKNELHLTINKCPITFATPDLIDFCDGEERVRISPGEASFASGSTKVTRIGKNQFTCNNGDVITLIPPVEYWEFSAPTPEEDAPKNGSSEKPWTYRVTRDGVDVTSNYDISFEYGTIKVCFWSI